MNTRKGVCLLYGIIKVQTNRKGFEVMALVQVDISSYEAFRSATIGNGYDIDGAYGFQ